MKKNCLVLFIFAVFGAPLFAQIASWELAGLSGVTSGVVSTTNVAPGVSSAILSRGPGIVPQSAQGAYGSSSWSTNTFIGPTDYYQIDITLSPSSPPIIRFGSLLVYVATTEPGPLYATLRSSQNAYATDINIPVTLDVGGSGFAGYLNFNLSSLSPVPPGGTVSLRLYGYEANSASSNARFDIGDGVNGVNVDIIFNASLPISLTSFTAIADSKEVVTRWTTDSEKDNDFFEIERSGDGRSFELIGTKDGAGTSTKQQTYTFTDEQPLTGNNYYRLRQVDYDGKVSYSQVVLALFNATENITISPSLATDLVHIQIAEPATADGLWQVFDVAGRLVQSGNWAAETDVVSIHVGTLTAGMYTFRFTMGQTVQVKQFRKQ
jgi:hypothetical protein